MTMAACQSLASSFKSGFEPFPENSSPGRRAPAFEVCQDARRKAQPCRIVGAAPRDPLAGVIPLCRRWRRIVASRRPASRAGLSGCEQGTVSSRSARNRLLCMAVGRRHGDGGLGGLMLATTLHGEIPQTHIRVPLLPAKPRATSANYRAKGKITGLAQETSPPSTRQ